MNECADCHEAVDYHTCPPCHDDHGAIEFADLPFYALITLLGDVPEPGFVRILDILPYQDHAATCIPMAEFLEEKGVDFFKSITLYSDDGGFVTIASADLSDRAWLLPYEDGIRCACEDQHFSTWLKGITGLIVVTEAQLLLVNGQQTSIGRLLLGPTVSYTVEQAEVSLRSDNGGKNYKAATASRLQDAALASLLDFNQVTALGEQTKNGEEITLEGSAFHQAFLTQFQGMTTLVLPERGCSEWIPDPVSIEAME